MLAKLPLFQSKYVFYELFFSFPLSLSLAYTHTYTLILCHPLVFARGLFYVSVIAIGHLRPPCASGDRKLQLYFQLSPIADLRIFGFYGRHMRWREREEKRERSPDVSLFSYPLSLRFLPLTTTLFSSLLYLSIGFAFSSAKRVSRFRNACLTPASGNRPHLSVIGKQTACNFV